MDTHRQTHQNGTGPLPQTEVVARAKRRRFSANYKRSILEEADRCTESGDIGALLRREGLYSSNLTTWRRQRQHGEFEGAKPGRKPTSEQAKELRQLQRENARLKRKLEQAEMVIEVQKKLRFGSVEDARQWARGFFSVVQRRPPSYWIGVDAAVSGALRSG